MNRAVLGAIMLAVTLHSGVQGQIIDDMDGSFLPIWFHRVDREGFSPGPGVYPGRGMNDARVIDNSPYPTDPEGAGGEPLLGAGNSGLFITKNDRGGIGGGKNDYEFVLGAAPELADLTLTARFKIDWSNNQNFAGDGILALHTKGAPGVAIRIQNVIPDSAPEYYVLQLEQFRGDTGRNHLADLHRLDTRPGFESAQTSPGFFLAQIYTSATTHEVRVRIIDEFTGALFDQTYTDLPFTFIDGIATFGAGLNESNQGGSELKVIFDYVRLEQGNTVGISPEDCQNGVDDDGDGQTDCADLECQAVPICQCPNPVYDVDADGDVDQEDFGAFQLCFTGSNISPDAFAALSRECRCMDRTGPGGSPDEVIDMHDLNVFTICATIPAAGPGMLDPACDN